MITLKILYFASLGEALGIREEHLTVDQNTATVGDVKMLLAARSSLWEKNICGNNKLLCAVNQSITDSESALKDGDEIALFPPVTGG